MDRKGLSMSEVTVQRRCFKSVPLSFVVLFFAETKTSPIPSSNAPQKAEPPVGRAARLLAFFSPLLLGMLLLLMW